MMPVSQGIDYILLDINIVGKHLRLYIYVHKVLIILLELSTF